jgi:predicted ester cyclase
VLQSVSESDLVSTRHRFTARQTGELLGMPATGKSFEVGAMDMIRWRDGKILEHWGLIDMPATMVQLGLMPAPGA